MTESATSVPSADQVRARLQALRKAMQAADLAAWIVPTADPHLSEYLPEHWQTRVWLSGFTGSAGTLVVTQHDARLWVDSRYWIQAEAQLANTGIAWMKWTPDAPSLTEWLCEHLPEQAQVGVSSDVVSAQQAEAWDEALADAGLTLDLAHDLIGGLWTERPALPQSLVYAHEAPFAPTSREAKLARLRDAMQAHEVDGHLLSSLDDIAWLLNLRGQDVDYNPVFLAHFWMDASRAVLFIDEQKVAPALRTVLEDAGVTLMPYDALIPWLSTQATGTIMLDMKRVSARCVQALPEDVTLSDQPNPTTLFKACKEPEALDHVREAMVQDGVALAEFFTAFEARLARGEMMTELTVDTLLTAARARRPHFVSLSFPTIAGFNANGALPHYQATSDAHAALDGDGLLLIDSGAQYLGGTTDITRVVPIGTPSAEQCRDYTTVLKGTIALSRAHFPEGLPAPMLDAIARAPLWTQDLDFGHGTGHGVGYFLNVHEGPQGISYHGRPSAQNAMREGMITSIEPGLYRTQQWGIRIENLVANRLQASNAFGTFLAFETLTLCPIDTRLIVPALMTHEELDWLNAYHATVYERLAPHVTGDVLAWLALRTQPVVACD